MREPGDDDDVGAFPVGEDGEQLIPLQDLLFMIAVGLVRLPQTRPSTTSRLPENSTPGLAWLRDLEQWALDERMRAEDNLRELQEGDLDLPADHERLARWDDSLRHYRGKIEALSSKGAG
jgi:hypothetical protein